MESWQEAMLRGDFAAAWVISERELENWRAHPQRQEAWPLEYRSVWRGQPLHGRVLVRCHHGLGDTLQFARFCSQLTQADWIGLKIQPELISLFRGWSEIDDLIPLTAPDPAYDVDVEVMELPFALRARADKLPPPAALRPRVDIARTQARLPGRLRVGLSWATGPFRPERGLSWALVEELTRGLDVQWVSLQRGPAALEAARSDVFINSEAPAEIGDTATLIERLDLVITVDTMIAHLAGTLGVPTCTLLLHECDWRWMREREDTPWYPRMRLLRQSSVGDWSEPIACARRAIASARARL